MIREATITDIPQLQIIRHSVKENVLSNPALVQDKDYEEYLAIRGRGWVYEVGHLILGFAITDLKDHNVWALFIRPEYEGQGIGKQLHHHMLNWYFKQTIKTIWLTTAFNTRAEKFYRMQGWSKAGLHGTKEIKFEMTFDNWKAINKFIKQ